MLEHRLEPGVPRIADDADLHRGLEALLVLQRGDPAGDAGGGEPEQLELLDRAGACSISRSGTPERHDPHLGMRRLQRLGEVGAEPVHDRAFLDRDERCGASCSSSSSIAWSSGLRNRAVDHRAVDAVGGQQLGRLRAPAAPSCRPRGSRRPCPGGAAPTCRTAPRGSRTRAGARPAPCRADSGCRTGRRCAPAPSGAAPISSSPSLGAVTVMPGTASM